MGREGQIETCVKRGDFFIPRLHAGGINSAGFDFAQAPRGLLVLIVAVAAVVAVLWLLRCCGHCACYGC